MPDFPTSFIYINNFLLIVSAAALTIWSHDPEHATPAGLAHIRFSLFRFRSPLLTESRLFSLPVGTEMFHFPTFPLSALYIQAEIMGHDSHWVPPFGNPRIKALLAAPRGFSQPHTTFFGFWSLGIRHLHLIIFLHCFEVKNPKIFNFKDARVHCVVLKIRAALGTLTAYQVSIDPRKKSR